MDYIKRMTGITTNELVAVSQDCDSSDGTATKQLNIIQASNNRHLMECWNSCCTKFSKFVYVR